MQLGDLLDDLAIDATTGRIEVTNVQIDSRQCAGGSLFFALSGATTNGVSFARDAVARGAVAVVASAPVDVAAPVLVVPATQLRALLSETSAAIVGHPEFGVELVGVTGTNGKTTVTTLVAQLARALGWNGANVGTLTNERTTPFAPELFRTLAQLVAEFDPSRERSVVALEVSSHALDQGRVDGLRFAVAAFTNLSHDHLDYHGSMERYFQSKASLFRSECAQRVVLWGDDPYGQRLAAMSRGPVSTVSRRDAHGVALSLRGTTFFWRDRLVNTPLVGGYNVDNALIAMSMVSVLGASDRDVAAAMSSVHGVDGRFEVVESGDVVVIVDYAHTPDGLRRLLNDVRELTSDGRIGLVFGCGGDRDREKRPQMGAVASELADFTIVTSDNPRSEAPEAIIDAIMSGVVAGATVRRERDRRRAIGEVLEWAQPGDVVVLAGKGHERTQIFADEVVAFDDRVVARELMR